jgi:hypothetical protein
MAKAEATPTRARLIVSALVVALVVVVVWKVIDYRQEPPPPPVQKSEARIPKSEKNPNS